MAKRPMAHRVVTLRRIGPVMAHRRLVPALLRGRAHLAGAGALLVLVFVAAATLGMSGITGSPSPTPATVAARSQAASSPSSASPTASPTPGTAAPTTEPPATPSASPSADASPSPDAASPEPSLPQLATTSPRPRLPALIGAIGDSYTQAFSTSPSEMYDHPGHSWSIGTTKGDGVYSLAERFQALGDNLIVQDAARSGTTMLDAPRQAGIILTAASGLTSPKIAFVTIALGTNDLCSTYMVATSTYESYFRQTMSMLRDGLPKGSIVLVQTLVDFEKLGNVTRGHAGPYACPRFLGPNVTAQDLAVGRAQRAAYIEILTRVCAQYEAEASAGPGLHCQTDAPSGASYFNQNFGLQDFSTVDYFHPSLAGEALMAESAWRASPWAGML